MCKCKEAQTSVQTDSPIEQGIFRIAWRVSWWGQMYVARCGSVTVAVWISCWNLKNYSVSHRRRTFHRFSKMERCAVLQFAPSIGKSHSEQVPAQATVDAPRSAAARCDNCRSVGRPSSSSLISQAERKPNRFDTVAASERMTETGSLPAALVRCQFTRHKFDPPPNYGNYRTAAICKALTLWNRTPSEWLESSLLWRRNEETPFEVKVAKRPEWSLLRTSVLLLLASSQLANVEFVGLSKKIKYCDGIRT